MIRMVNRVTEILSMLPMLQTKMPEAARTDEIWARMLEPMRDLVREFQEEHVVEGMTPIEALQARVVAMRTLPPELKDLVSEDDPADENDDPAYRALYSRLV
jgi:uncharacterized protein YicC (UPF0701 family)